MLLRFRFSNFRSFRTEHELSLMAGKLKGPADGVVEGAGSGGPVLTAAGIYGANASGKTNVLRALQFMARAVASSHADWHPDQKIVREAFAGEDEREPTEFCVDFLIDGVRYQYGFSVSNDEVLQEWLSAYPNGKRQAWFKRATGKSMAFSEKMGGDNRTIAGLTRPNSLFLSAAAQNNHAALLPVYRWFRRSLRFVFGDREPWFHRSTNRCADPNYKRNIEQFLGFADLGIVDLRVSDAVPSEEANRFASDVAAALTNLLKTTVPPSSVQFLPKRLELVHQLGDRSIPFDSEHESAGTIAFIALLGPILDALSSGSLVCVDELDASLHPLLARTLIQFFSDKSKNPKGAQLIFSTHDTNLLSADVLRRDQIWFTEKKADGESVLYPLTDFKPRESENLASGYLQGRYGAIPFVNSDCLRRDTDTEHESE